MQTAAFIETYATADHGHVRVQAWSGDIVRGASVCASFTITSTQAQELIDQLTAAIRSLPRVGSPADLGCAVL